MAQVPSYQVPAHPSGLEMRTQLNAIILAMIGDNAGPTEPAEQYPGMWWGNTTAGRLMRRNNANTAWVDLGPLDDFLSDIRTLVNDTAATKVNRSGDTMTGPLTMIPGIPVLLSHAGGVARLTGDPNSAMAGIINHAGNAWNIQIHDDGRAIFRNHVQILGGGLYSAGRVHIQNSDLQLQGGPHNWQMFMRYDPSGAVARMEWINDAYNSVIASLDNGGSMILGGQLALGNGQATVSPDGNISGPVWGGWLSNFIGNRAVAGAQTQWNSGINEFAQWTTGQEGVHDAPAPWVMIGTRTINGLGWIWSRAILLRNQ